MNKEEIAKMDNDGLIYTTINQQEAGIYFNGVKIANVEEWNNVVNELIHYKAMWEELKAIYNHNDDKSKNEIMVLGKIRELEKKHNIGGVE